MKEETGLVAIESKLGWILSGVVETKKSNIGHNNANEVSVTNLILQQEVGLRDKTDELKTQLQRFWEMETIGIHDIAKESSAPKNEEFLSHIANDGKRYSVKLPIETRCRICAKPLRPVSSETGLFASTTEER